MAGQDGVVMMLQIESAYFRTDLLTRQITPPLSSVTSALSSATTATPNFAAGAPSNILF